ncbi:hypothetical protein ABZ770_36020 [Streptomyces sp. NPDC006654]|uniref:hypothetical protein n=1 Tax=Streptomyces sp. NPDC006654 TaxID=3156897 RepID=UPI0033F04801
MEVFRELRGLMDGPLDNISYEDALSRAADGVRPEAWRRMITRAQAAHVVAAVRGQDPPACRAAPSA